MMGVGQCEGSAVSICEVRYGTVRNVADVTSGSV
jgi:hypothetical protein